MGKQMHPPSEAEAVTIAEAHIRGARVGEPQFLSDRRSSGCEPMSDSAEQKLRSLGASDAIVEKMKEIINKRLEQPRWEVGFLLHDRRYTDGITIATVRIHDATGHAELKVFERGGPTNA